jgi:hypothetical protein
MACCLMHRYRGLAVLVRSYRDSVCCAIASCLMHRYRGLAVLVRSYKG